MLQKLILILNSSPGGMKGYAAKIFAPQDTVRVFLEFMPGGMFWQKERLTQCLEGSCS